MKNPLLAIDTKFTIYKLYKLHSNRSRFSDDFPTISFASHLPVGVAHSIDYIYLYISSFCSLARSLTFVCVHVLGLFHTVWGRYYCRRYCRCRLFDSVLTLLPARSIHEPSVHFLETNFGVSVLKLFPYVMIWRQFLHFLVGFARIRFSCIVNCLPTRLHRHSHRYKYIASFTHSDNDGGGNNDNNPKPMRKCFNRTHIWDVEKDRHFSLFLSAIRFHFILECAERITFLHNLILNCIIP